MPPSASPPTSYRVLVSDPIDAEGVRILKELATVDVKTGLTEAELCEIIPEYDALMVRSGTKVTSKIIQTSRKLKIIGRAGVGVDNVDVLAATAKGVYVVNSPLGNVIAAAELSFGLMIALARHVPRAEASVRGGRWERSKFLGVQLHGKTLGVIGFGQVGRHVALMARAAGMKLVAHDPEMDETKAKELHCSAVTLEELLKTSDFITIHTPLNDTTRHLINAERLRSMKPSARVINTARGGVLDEVALVAALKEGVIAGAALDVFEVEAAFSPDHPLLSAPNLIMTPHLGASTQEAQKFVAIDTAQQICATLKGDLPASAVNMPMKSSAALTAMRPLMKCCESLGRIARQLLSEPMQEVEVVVEGEHARHDGLAIQLAVANGALGAQLDDTVNYVNVKMLADRHDVHLSLRADSKAVKACVRVTVSGASQSSCVVGSVTREGLPLLESIENFPVFLILPEAGNATMIFCHSMDQPHTLSSIATVLGKASLNIANCHLGRMDAAPGGSAVSLFHIDGNVAPETIAELELFDFLVKCRTFKC